MNGVSLPSHLMGRVFREDLQLERGAKETLQRSSKRPARPQWSHVVPEKGRPSFSASHSAFRCLKTMILVLPRCFVPSGNPPASQLPSKLPHKSTSHPLKLWCTLVAAPMSA